MPLAQGLKPHAIALAALLCVVTILYWHSLNGPFMFDDGWNLRPIEQWNRGEITWRQAVFGDGSILMGRPVAMASFTLTTWLGGMGAFPFKLGNLALHLLCTVLIWTITRAIAQADAKLARSASIIALLTAAFWALHPLHVSSVLYAVQRMAQLSSLFVLVSIQIYLIARRQAEQGHYRTAAINLFIAFPITLLAGLLSKQNAIVAPLLCAVIELAYFWHRPGRKLIATFIGASLVIPGLVATALLLIFNDRLLAGYQEWNFTLTERLLTQSRALADYLSMIVLPRAPQMGLYTDDFPISTGMLSPPSTSIAIAVLVAISIAAVALKKRAPIIFAGWFFFLGAHLVESSILPLEMYYEHRNYLPSIGIFWLMVGGIACLPAPNTNLLSARQLAMGAASLFAVMLSFATLGRTLIWDHKESIIEQGLLNHPHSIRAIFDRSAMLLEKKDYRGNQMLMLDLARTSQNPQHRVMAYMNLVAMNCLGTGDADPAYLLSAGRDVLPRITVFESEALKLMTEVHTEKGSCGRATPALISDFFTQLINRASAQPDSAAPKLTSRHYTAIMLARAGRWDQAIENAEIAWAQGRVPATGALLTRFYVHEGRPKEAWVVFKKLESAIPAYNLAGQAELTELRSYFRNAGHPIP